MVKKNKALGDTDRKILKMILENKTMKYTQIKNELELTDAAVSRHLSNLIKDEAITFEKKGREKHYRLAKNSKTFEGQSALLSIMLTSIYDISPSEFKSLSELLRYISENTGFIFLFILLQSIKTGKKWTVSFNAGELFREASDLLVYGLFEKNVDVEKLRVNIFKNPDLFLQEVHELSKNKKNGPLIDELLELLEESDAEKFKNLMELFEHSMTEYDI